MNLQKKLASKIMNCSHDRVVLSSEHAEELKGAITKFDVRKLINKGVIQIKPARGVSRFRAKKIHEQKLRGRRRGHGSRKGGKKVRTNPKRAWINKVRLQRKFLSRLKQKNLINKQDYREIYYKIGGGFFRSLNHLKLTIEERGLIKK